MFAQSHVVKSKPTPRATAFVPDGVFRLIVEGKKHEQYLYLAPRKTPTTPLVERIKLTYERKLGLAWSNYELALAYLNFLEEQNVFAQGVIGVRRDGGNPQ